ncbi:MAG TPA: ATP-binding protein [Burkholderiaceae bacterium]|nr:ATP-binding protein [Burkholderiaceae bacterium]
MTPADHRNPQLGITPGPQVPHIHPIVALDYRVRVPAHLCTLLMLVSSFASTGAAIWVWGLAVFYGLVWPHLAHSVSMRSRDSKAAELRNLQADSIFAGVFAALTGFSLWPSVVLATGINAASLSVGGARFALGAFVVCVLSGAAAGAFTGYRFTPDSTLVTSLICAASFFGYVVIFSLRTNTEARRLLHAQRELRATNERMEEQQRNLEQALELAESANRAKSSFLANMSHELRTPLNAIIGYAEMLEEDVDDAAQRADLQRINSSGKHLLGLINDVLDLSKIEAGKVELHIDAVDVRQLTEQVMSATRPLLNKNGNRLELQLQEPLGEMTTDAARLRQVLLNLLSNAAKFTHQGEVRMSVRRTGEPPTERIVFEIGDTGIGMTPAQLETLFVPFVQADSATTRKYGGSGLGLAISRRLCEVMGGEIEVQSEIGRGTCCTVTLPAQWMPATSAPTESPHHALR